MHTAATGVLAFAPPRTQNATADESGVAGARSEGQLAGVMPNGIVAPMPSVPVVDMLNEQPFAEPEMVDVAVLYAAPLTEEQETRDLRQTV